MLQLRNTSPFVATMFSMPDARGVDTLVIVIKASFALTPAPKLAEQQRPILAADEYWGDPTSTSLRYPGELHLSKPGTDVIVIGDACAPHGQAVPNLEVSVRVAERSKRVRVYGERMWVVIGKHAQPSRPQPFVRVPIVYERAYGGRTPPDPAGRSLAEPRNPVGRGFVGDGNLNRMLEQLLPNIDDPDNPLAWLGQTPAPVGLAAIAPSWQPRIAHAGTYDDAWRKHRAPYLPTNFDARFHRVASEGLGFDGGLDAGAPMAFDGFDPTQAFAFALPRCQLDVSARVAGAMQSLQAQLDTVVIELLEPCWMSMTWRASLAVERLLRVERVDIGLASLEVGGPA
jgi:hypothetical protein